MIQTATLVGIFRETSVKEGIAPGMKVAWTHATEDSTRGATLIGADASSYISNADLLEAAKRCQPPQSWYDEDHDGLY
jgi:hypothetical protein